MAERLGDRDRERDGAAREYRFVVEAWRQPDPELHAQAWQPRRHLPS